MVLPVRRQVGDDLVRPQAVSRTADKSASGTHFFIENAFFIENPSGLERGRSVKMVMIL